MTMLARQATRMIIVGGWFLTYSSEAFTTPMSSLTTTSQKPALLYDIHKSNWNNGRCIHHRFHLTECFTSIGGNIIDTDDKRSTSSSSSSPEFDLDTALFCGGLAFDAYVEPPANSSRWERGSKGMNVAFLSAAFTRNLYKGLVEVTPIQVTGLPEEDDNVEAVMTGGGVDACILVAAVEGQWKEDIELLAQGYHSGILDLSGAAHVGRSSTAWSNVNENKSKASKRKTGKALPYHIPKDWGKDASAIWPEEEPFYLYVQEPSKVQLLFTLFDDDVIGDGSALGSTYTPLSKVLPQVSYSQDQVIAKVKNDIVDKIKRGQIDPSKLDEEVAKALAKNQAWEGDLKLTSKPRIKDKNGQVALGMAAGAMVAGPVGAAVGAALGNLYEGTVKGRIKLRLRYLPIAATQVANALRTKYDVLGGMPGINWGELYSKYLSKQINSDSSEALSNANAAGNDLEHCFFINHDKTGGCCAVYRSLEKRLIVVSFRGTCKPVDLFTDASIVQEPWVEGEEEPNKNKNNNNNNNDNEKKDDIAKVHVGFRSSMNSISRRLKELLLATVAPGENIADYDMLITGHSLGGALATLFIADIGEYGIDAGRALPQREPSDAWWKAITNTFMGQEGKDLNMKSPPRPKSLRLYNFGSPRVGNNAFAKRFDEIVKKGHIDEAYRIVNGKDVVARMPRTMMTLSIDYDHCGKTVLVEEPEDETMNEQEKQKRILWIEGESDDRECPVRDYKTRVSSPTGEGTLLGDLLALTKTDETEAEEGDDVDDGNVKETGKFLNQIGTITSKFQKRMSTVTVSDLTSVVGIDKSFTDRELQIGQALFKGQALAHHMEDSYYGAMGRASGFNAEVGEEISPLVLVSRTDDDDKEEENNVDDVEVNDYNLSPSPQQQLEPKMDEQ